MAFKPINAGKSKSGNNDFEPRNMPVPKAGSRKARVSLIVDLGIQRREDFEDPKTGEVRPQKPQQQVAVFADLVSDIVDYGGKIGKAQYRLLLNKSFKGEVQGINFAPVPPRDGDGNIIEGKPWGLHPANLLTKLAKAVGKEEIIYDEGPNGMDISLLLDQPFIAQVEVKVTEGKKKDADGNPIIYKNVNYKGCTPIPTVEDEETGEEKPMTVAKLTQPARCITFDSATVEDIQFIRSNLLRMIKNAENYPGSQMQKAVEAYEAKNGSKANDEQQEEEQEEEAPKTTAKAKAKPKAAPVEVEDEDDVPF